MEVIDMTGRGRVKAAMRFQAVDKVPLQYYSTPVGFYEHGEKLNSLYASLPGDFGPFCYTPAPALPSSDFDADGQYHTFTKDEWGTVWERRIFGIAGIPAEYPLNDPKDICGYAFPPHPSFDEKEARERVRSHQEEYYCLMNSGSLFERMRALRPEEDVLCDIALSEPLLDVLTDRIIEHHMEDVRRAVASGADGINFGDDYGTERGMLMSPGLWRSFFKPRLRELFRPAVDAGLDIVFHSCGMVMPILPDLKDIGVTAIWPQLPVYNMRELANICRELSLAVAIHTDRANVMTFGTPGQVRALAEEEFEAFRMMDGGSWFYVEVDNGFPFENIEALVKTIAQWR
jgi:hypothetical protein